MQNCDRMKTFHVKGWPLIAEARTLKDAIFKLVDRDGGFTYRPHWYSHSDRKSWAEVTMTDGYVCIVEEV